MTTRRAVRMKVHMRVSGYGSFMARSRHPHGPILWSGVARCNGVIGAVAVTYSKVTCKNCLRMAHARGEITPTKRKGKA